MKRLADDDGLGMLPGAKRSKRITLAPHFRPMTAPGLPSPSSSSITKRSAVGMNARLDAMTRSLAAVTGDGATVHTQQRVKQTTHRAVALSPSPPSSYSPVPATASFMSPEPPLADELFRRPPTPLLADDFDQPMHQLYTRAALSPLPSPPRTMLRRPFTASAVDRTGTADSDMADVFSFHPPPLSPTSPRNVLQPRFDARLPFSQPPPPAAVAETLLSSEGDDIYSRQARQLDRSPSQCFIRPDTRSTFSPTPIPGRAGAQSEASSNSVVGAASLEDPFTEAGFSIWHDSSHVSL